MNKKFSTLRAKMPTAAQRRSRQATRGMLLRLAFADLDHAFAASGVYWPPVREALHKMHVSVHGAASELEGRSDAAR